MKTLNKESKYFTISFIFIFIFFAFVLYQKFLFDIAIAIILVISTFSMNEKLLKLVKNKTLFVTTSTLLLSVTFIIPLTFLILSASTYLSGIDAEYISSIILKTKNFIINIVASNEYLKTYKNDISQLIDAKYIASNVISLGKVITSLSVNFIKDIAMILIFYTLILVYLNSITAYISSMVPFPDKKLKYFSNNITSNMSITFLAIIITAVLEGFLFSILVSYFDYDAWLFGISFAIASLIPIVGAALLWLPLSLYEYFNGNLQNAIIISLYTIIVISIITDTFIKAYIIKLIKENMGHSNIAINEIILLFSIIAGLSQFGFWGVLIGPIISIILFSLLDFYRRNYKQSTEN